MNNVKLLPSLLIFAEIAKQGSFTAAAKHLGLSKSAVSQQLTRLESVVGSQLLIRNTRGLSVTAVGKRLLERCELLQDQVDLALAELSTIEVTPTGRFAVTFPHSLERDIVIPAVRQLCQEYPGLEPHITVTDQAMDLVQDNLDVAIYAGELKDSQYRALPLGMITEVWCASPAYLQRKGSPVKPEELVEHSWIATNWQKSPIAVYGNALNSDAQHISLQCFGKANTLPCTIEMAKQHMGLVLLPDIVANPLIADNTFVRVLPEYRGPVWPCYFVHPFQAEKPRHVTRFYQLVSHYFVKNQGSR